MSTPEPPYYAVIFASQRTDAFAAEYAAAGERMMTLATAQPGFLGVDSARDSSGFGITVSYWESLEAIAAWRHHAEHTDTRNRGRQHFYAHYSLRVARVERATTFVRTTLDNEPLETV